MKLLYPLSISLFCILAVSCAREESGLDLDRNPDEIAFAVSTGFVDAETEPETKTVYSGDRPEFSAYNQKYERIDWKEGDRIRIGCRQASSVRGESVNYVVLADGTTETASVSGVPGSVDKNSLAEARPETIDGKTDGLCWKDGSTLHHFFAVYPDTGVTLSIGEGISGDIGEDIATVSGSVPQTQTVSSGVTKPVNGKTVLEFEPDMSKVAMAAYSQQAGRSGEVPLFFKPLVTAVRFELLAHSLDGVSGVEGYKLTRLRLQSEDTDETTFDSGGNPIMVEAGRLWGNYKVAFGKFDTHPYTFSGGRGINDGLHDIDGQDNAFAVVSAGFPGSQTLADNYIDIEVPDGGVALKTDTPAAFTFLCLPMTQNKLSLKLTFSNGSTTRTRTLKLKHNDSWISLRGHYKTYFDALEVHRPTYILQVLPIDRDFPTTASQQSDYFSIVSYQGEATKVPVKWTATFSDEGDHPDKYKADPPDWISEFFYQDGTHISQVADYTAMEGNTEAAPKYYTVAVKENSVTSWSLKAAAETPGKGEGATTVENAPDLSYRDIYGNNRSTQETANCYVVSGRGFYKFPAVYGNAIMASVANTEAYSPNKTATISEYSGNILRTFLRHDGNPILGPWIEDDNSLIIESAELLWQDTQDLVRNVSLRMVTGKKYVTFEIHDNVEGNAVIAVKNAGGDVLWSWHIWCVHNPEGELSTISIEPYLSRGFNTEVAPGHTVANEIMHSNLGFCRTSDTGSEDRVCHVKFRQVDDAGNDFAGAATAYMVISQVGSEKGSCVTLYQWGRKDPMFSSRLADDEGGYVRNSRIYTVFTSQANPYPTGGTYPNPPAETASGNGVAYSIQHPVAMLRGPNGATSLQSWAGTSVYFNLWNSNVTQPVRRIGVSGDARNDDWNFTRKDLEVRKTVYDPCPPGFCVPNEYAFTLFSLYKYSGGSHYGGRYPGTLLSNINAAVLPGLDKMATFDRELGFDFFATESQSHSHGRVFLRAVGRRNGNGASGNFSQMDEIPQKNPAGGKQTNATGSYWTAAPYLLCGTNTFVYGRVLRFQRSRINSILGSGSTGDAGLLTSHALPIRPIGDKFSDRNPAATP